MKLWESEEAAWTIARLQDRVSIRGWLLAMFVGVWLWSVVVAVALRV